MAAKKPEASKRTTPKAKGSKGKKQDKPKGKNPGGRPSTYPSTPEDRQALCDRVIALASEGLSECEISVEIDVPRKTMHRWAEEHKEFRAALTRAKEQEQAWWERTGRNALNDKEFNHNLWVKSMQARFRDEYTERRKVDHGVQDSLAKFMDRIDGKDGRIPNG